MNSYAKFEKWWNECGGSSRLSDLCAWESALASLEVTPELVEIATDAFMKAESYGLYRVGIESALQAVFASIKEGKV